jgi:hypothetical protein
MNLRNSFVGVLLIWKQVKILDFHFGIEVFVNDGLLRCWMKMLIVKSEASAAPSAVPSAVLKLDFIKSLFMNFYTGIKDLALWKLSEEKLLFFCPTDGRLDLNDVHLQPDQLLPLLTVKPCLDENTFSCSFGIPQVFEKKTVAEILDILCAYLLEDFV